MRLSLLLSSLSVCSAILPSTTSHDEDLSAFSLPRGSSCADLIGWPQVPKPISCDDPQCRGISWATPPFRCRQRGGVMPTRPVFGCPCCPRLIDCDDPRCAGNPLDEVCHSELLSQCICLSPSREGQPANSAGMEPDSAPLIQDRAITRYETNTQQSRCPIKPPIMCLDPQCRGADDWIVSTRCNRDGGGLVVDGVETHLEGCPCCPEFIECNSVSCNGDSTRTCSSELLYGCFCDWPGRGPVLMSSEFAEVHAFDEEAFIFAILNELNESITSIPQSMPTPNPTPTITWVDHFPTLVTNNTATLLSSTNGTSSRNDILLFQFTAINLI